MSQQRRIQHAYTGINNLGQQYIGPPGVEVAKVVAVEGLIDWACYVENEKTRGMGNTDEAIALYGHKLKSPSATEIFPEWADRLPYRD
jgi:hypothetical protein